MATDNELNLPGLDSAQALLDLRFLMEGMHDAVFLKNPELVYVGCNNRYAEDRGLEPAAIAGLTDFDLHPDSLARKYRADDRLVLDERSYRIIDEVDISHGVSSPVQTVKTALRNAQGETIGLLGSYRHTQRVLEEPRMRRAIKAIEQLPQGFVFTDRHFCTIDANPAYGELTDNSPHSDLGSPPPFFANDGQHFSQSQRIGESLAQQGQWQGELWEQRQDGDYRSVWASISSMNAPRDADCQYVAWFSDIHHRQPDMASLRHLAYHDSLTGLPNRLLFLDRLDQALRRAQRSGEQVAVLFLDTDGFKSVNDTHGHAVGDKVLQEIGARLQGSLREGDTVSRLGGDEFTLVLEGINAREAGWLVCGKLCDSLRAPFQIDDLSLQISASVGIALFPDHGNDSDTLLRHADEAMYQAKRAGGDRCKVFSDSAEASGP